jgi:hypothetical protein
LPIKKRCDREIVLVVVVVLLVGEAMDDDEDEDEHDWGTRFSFRRTLNGERRTLNAERKDQHEHDEHERRRLPASRSMVTVGAAKR